MKTLLEAIAEQQALENPQTPKEEKSRYRPAFKHPTLCWKCLHAVPNKTRTIGCEWSLRFEPVPGWDATPTSVYTYALANAKYRTIRNTPKRNKLGLRPDDDTITSFRVHSCPKFVKG